MNDPNQSQPQQFVHTPEPAVASSAGAPIGGLAYPTAFPFDSVKEVVRMVNSKSVLQERPAFARHLWVVQGYAMKQLLGDPDQAQDLNVLQPAQRTDTVIDMLDQLLKQQAGPQAQALEGGVPVVQALPLPVGMLLQWSITQLVMLLKEELGAQFGSMPETV